MHSGSTTNTKAPTIQQLVTMSKGMESVWDSAVVPRLFERSRGARRTWEKARVRAMI